MLENVFSKTKFVEGEKQLSLKYQPRNTSECCISESDLINVKKLLNSEKFFAVHSESGCGATICLQCIANEMGSFFVHEISCANGCSEVLKIIKQKMANVLLALQQQAKSILFFIKDIEILKRNEKSQIISAIEECNVHAVVFFNNSLYHTKWKKISFSPLTMNDKMIHLCWICAEEKLDIELETIQKLAEFHDLRNAINSLAFKKSTNIQERDYHTIDDFSKMLFAHETMQHQDMEVLSSFAELLCVSDTAEFKSTRYWYSEIISDFIDNQGFEYTHKQSLVARNAQMTHRVGCLQNACKLFSIPPTEMKTYAFLYRNLLLNNTNPLKTTSPTYEHEARALYTIAKIGASSQQCKIIKKTMGLK